jgi:Big-like domain-containing protein
MMITSPIARLASGLCLLFALPSAHAEELVLPTQTATLNDLPGLQSISVPAFDPALGVLQCVEVALSGNVSGGYGFENTSNFPCTVDSNLTVGLQLLPESGFIALAQCVIEDGERSANLSGFDGQNDCRAPSGVSYPVAFDDGCEGLRICGDDMQVFVGTGLVDLRARGTVNFSQSSQCIPDTCDGVRADVRVTVTYRYTPGTPDAATTDEGQCVQLDVLANDCLGGADSCGSCGCTLDPLSLEILSGPTNGQAQHLGGGVIEYCPDLDYCGPDQLTYRVADQTGSYTPPITVGLTVNPLNDCPVAVADQAGVVEDSAALIAVLTNDTDADAGGCGSGIDPSSVTITTAPAHGTAVPDASGRVLYTPNADYCGPDSFGYRIGDGLCTSDEATVTIDVTPLNDLPIAQDDAASVLEGGMVPISVLANDSDPDDGTACGAGLDPGSVVILQAPTLGSVQVLGTGVVRYTSFVGACGVDKFTYRVSDLAGLPTQSASVNVTVSAVNETPVAAPDIGVVAEGANVLLSVAANDSDADDGTLCGGRLVPGSVQISTPATNGTAVPDGSGGVLYTPATDFCGVDQFEYTIADAAGAVSAPALVRVDVQAVNECPVTVDDVATTPEGQMIGIVVLANDYDPDTGSSCGAVILPASVTVVTPPMHGSTTVNLGGKVLYTPEAGYCGPDSFRYLISDADGCISTTASVAIDVTPVNVCPVAMPDSTNIGEGLSIDIPVAANDSDADDVTDCGGGLVLSSVQIESGPAHGKATPDGLGGVTYEPNLGFCGVDSFQYTIADEDGCRSPATEVSINVVPVNAPPDAGRDQASTQEDVSVLIAVLQNDIDSDELSGCGAGIAPETVEVVMAPAHGQAVPDGLGGVNYIPDPDFCGLDQFYYRVADEDGSFSGATPVNVKVTGDNDCPVAIADRATTPEDTPIVMDLLANDLDADTGSSCGSGLIGGQLVLVTQPRNGKLALDPSGGVLYQPDLDFCGRDLFRYSVADAAGCVSPPVSVSILVIPDDDCPVALNDSYEMLELDLVYLNVLDNDYDPDELGNCGGVIDPSTVTIVNAPSRASISVEPDGRVRYEGLPEQCGSDSFSYTVTDETGCVSNEATVTVQIIAVNSRPIARDDLVRSVEGESIEFDVLKMGLPDEDYDPDGTSVCGAPIDPCSVTMRAPDQGELTLGTLEVSGCGRFIYTPFEEPGAGQTLIDRFRYTVSDTDDLESEPAVVTIELLGAPPEPPVANDDYATTNSPDPVEIDVLANDTDPNDDILPGSLAIIDQPDCGTVVLLGGGIVEFTPDADACGECSFTYSVEDVTGLEATATVTVDVFCECASGPRDRRRPGSLLLYPQYDSRPGSLTYITVTNTNPSQSVKVEYDYVNGEDCSRFDRTHLLTPNDTLSVVAEYHHPDSEQGFLYLFAKHPETGQAIVHNGLIGQVMVLDGVEMFGLECNAVSFQGVGADGLSTDLDGDGVRDLNGLEYEEAPGEILIPRFFGQIPGQVRSELILVALTGGRHFTTHLSFEIFNDNEELFSRQHSFQCWQRLPLLELAGATSNHFLSLLANDDPSEVIGAAGAIQTGWIRIQGDFADSNAISIEDPAFYAMLIEGTNSDRASSDLPFEFCTKDTGDLMPMGLLGDQD